MINSVSNSMANEGDIQNIMDKTISTIEEASPNAYKNQNASNCLFEDFNSLLRTILQESHLTYKLATNCLFEGILEEETAEPQNQQLEEKLLNEYSKTNENQLNENIQFKELFINPLISAVNNVMQTERSSQQIIKDIFNGFPNISTINKTSSSLNSSEEGISSLFTSLFTILDHIIPFDIEITIKSLQILYKITSSDKIIKMLEKFIEESNYAFTLRLIEIFNECDESEFVLKLILKIMNNVIHSNLIIVTSIRDGFIQFISETCVPINFTSLEEESQIYNNIINNLLEKMLSIKYQQTIIKYGREGIIELFNKMINIESPQIQKKIQIFADIIKCDQEKRKQTTCFSRIRIYA